MKPGSKSVAGKGVLKVVWSLVAPARRGDVAVAAGRPAKGGHGASGHASCRSGEAVSTSVSSALRFGAWMLTLMQAAAFSCKPPHFCEAVGFSNSVIRQISSLPEILGCKTPAGRPDFEAVSAGPAMRGSLRGAFLWMSLGKFAQHFPLRRGDFSADASTCSEVSWAAVEQW